MQRCNNNPESPPDRTFVCLLVLLSTSETHGFGLSKLVCDCGVLMGLGMPFALSVQRTSFGAGLALPNSTLAYTRQGCSRRAIWPGPLLTEPSSSVWSPGRDSYLLVSF
jgi:hypothetical protein